MVKFEQAYHFMTDCPLRGLTYNPLKLSRIGKWFRDNTHPILLNAFEHGDYVQAGKDFSLRLQELEKVAEISGKRLKIGMFQTAILRTIVASKAKESVPIKQIGACSYGSMDAYVDFARFKSNNTCELIWFQYDTILPSIETQDILSYFVTWNSRAFELKYEVRPYLLTLYYPLIGDSVIFQYNFRNGMDVVADMIEMGVYYAKPKKESCLQCQSCPEYARMV